MALTVSYDRGTGPGAGRTQPVFASSGRTLKFVPGQIAFDDSYPTGGESISAIADEFAELLGIFFENKAGYSFSADYTANAEKVLAYHADNDAVADSALIEVPDTTDLEAVTGVRFLAWGHA